MQIPEIAEPSYVADGDRWHIHIGNSPAVLQSFNIELPYDPAVALLGTCPENENMSASIYSSQKVNTTQNVHQLMS